MDIQLQPIPTKNGNDGLAYSNERVKAAGNGDGADRTSNATNATERISLLTAQDNGRNRETIISDHEVEAQRILENKNTPQEKKSVCRIIGEIILPNVRQWMVILTILLAIAAVIIISLVLCSGVIHDDEDEKFDPSLFEVLLYFNGSFRLPNQVFTEELFTLSSNGSQALTFHLQEKIGDLYRDSPALGRYFSKAEIYALRNGSVIADYGLTFLMPVEQQDYLRNFTLSWEMVYNVFRQFLYDQELDNSEPMYVDPLSLNMY